MTLHRRAAGLGLAAALLAPVGATFPLSSAPSAVIPPAAAATAVTPVAAPVAARVKFGARVLHVASTFKGTPYRYGGTSPHGFDCSGFTRFVFSRFHVELPRTAEKQFERARPVTHPQIGDLIFYHAGQNGHVYHVGIYAGPGQVWHAPARG